MLIIIEYIRLKYVNVQYERKNTLPKAVTYIASETLQYNIKRYNLKQ